MQQRLSVIMLAADDLATLRNFYNDYWIGKSKRPTRILFFLS
ncbi:hypothetical protein [Dyadobacter sp. 22481]